MIQKLNTKLTINKDLIQAPNLTDRFGEEDLTTIGNWVNDGYKKDKTSRFKWERRMESGMDLAMQVQKDKNFPWPGSANVVFPLVTIAALQFSARSYGNIIQGTDVVRYRVVGNDDGGDLIAKALRISKHMSWQVLEEDTAWEEQHDRLLINLAIVGCNFVKTYFNPQLGHNVSELVMARDFVLDYYAKSVEQCARKSQVIGMYRNEIYENCQAGIFSKSILDSDWFQAPAPVPESEPKQDNRLGVFPGQTDDDTPYQGIEQHRFLDLDGDGYAEPYIVTIETDSAKVLRIVSRISREEDIDHTASGKIAAIRATEYYTKYGFIPAADGGIYDTGFGTLLGPLNESVNAGINQLLDAGTMSNSNGGFLGRGVKIRGGQYSFVPWEWKRIDSTGDDIRKSMVPFPVREPSNVMFQLLGLLIEYTDRVAGTTDQQVGVSPGQNTPAETSRNTAEAGMQVYSSIFKRVWRSFKEEFKKLHKLNATFLPQKQKYGASTGFALQEDYLSNPDLVVPVADPNITSKSMRITQAAMVRQAAHEVPGYNVQLVEQNFLRAMGVENIDNLYPGPDKVPPLPNPKMQVEEMKLEAKKMQLEYKKQETIAKLQSERALVQAQIQKLSAETLKIVSDANIEHAELKIKSFETAIEMMKSHNEMLTNSIETLQSLSGTSDERTAKPRTVGNVESRSGNDEAAGAAKAMAGLNS